MGYNVKESDPLRIVVYSDDSFSGYEMAASLRAHKCEPECCDESYVVMMLTPYNTDEDLRRIKEAFLSLRNNGAADDKETAAGYDCLKNFIS
jgi:arginine/lysine/ornithine decarboxylase